MTDKVYTFQQNLIIQDIERLSWALSNPGTSKRVKAELFRGIQRAVYREKAIPERLKPNVYFRKHKSTWKNRPSTPVIKSWLVEIHKYYDDSHSRSAAR